MEVLQVTHPKTPRKVVEEVAMKKGLLKMRLITLLERQRTAGHAGILVEMAEKPIKRKLELLQKSLECEREKIFEEFGEVKYNVEFANSEMFTSKKGFLLNEKGNFELPPHEHESCNNNPFYHRTIRPAKPKKNI